MFRLEKLRSASMLQLRHEQLAMEVWDHRDLIEHLENELRTCKTVVNRRVLGM